MPQERVRVLVDRSRDSGWSGALVDIEPDTIYQTTDNRDYLNWSVLKNYDVLAICGIAGQQHRATVSSRMVRSARRKQCLMTLIY